MMQTRKPWIMRSLISRPLPDFISQLWRNSEFLHSCKIKSGSGLFVRSIATTFLHPCMQFITCIHSKLSQLPVSEDDVIKLQLECSHQYSMVYRSSVCAYCIVASQKVGQGRVDKWLLVELLVRELS